MWRPASAVVLAAVVLAGGRPAGPGSPACDGASAEVNRRIQETQADGQDVRDRLVAQLDRLLDRYGREGSACVAQLRMDRVSLTTFSGQYDETVATASAFLSDGVVQQVPTLHARMLRDRGLSLDNVGQTVDAWQDYIAAAALVPRLPAATASATLRDLAEYAAAQNDWAAAMGAHRRAMRILRDSSAADPDGMRVRIGRLWASHAYLLQKRAEHETDPTRRRRLARRLVAAADTAAAIVRAHRTDNPTEAAFDRGTWALALSDGAYGAAILGLHGVAASRIDAALVLASPEVQSVFPYALSDVWLRRAETEQMAGHFEAAARAAGRARAECETTEDMECETATLETMAGIAEEAGRLDDAAVWYREATTLQDIAWERGRLQDWSASAFAAIQAPYRGLTRVLVQQGRPAEAFAVLDGSRARTLRDMRAHLALQEDLTPARRGHIDSLLEAVRTERLALLGDTLDTEEQASVTLHVSRLQARIAAATRQSGARFEALDVPGLQRTLRAQGRTLVSYLVGDHETVAFVVAADTLVARMLPTTGLDVQHLMRQAGGPWQPGGPDPAVRLGPLHTLHELLVRPLRDVLPDSSGLVIIPDGPLADLPFEMLVEAPATDYASARFLVRRLPVSTDLAAALIIDDANRPAAEFGVDLVAFGRGKFDGQGGTWRGRSGPVLANLPNVAREIARVRSHIRNRQTAIDDDATEARFSAEAGRARIVHVASHAEADPAFPLYSRVYLWDDPEADDDGVVHLFELQDLRLPADLVVLSGCSTAAGQAQAGEGTIGLQYGVRAAGARAALATLWPVDDRATAEIVDAFYEGLAAGLPKDRALQRAQVAYLDRHDGAKASPYYWASAVLSGSPAPVPLHAPAPLWPWGLGAAVLLAGAGGLAWRARRRPAAG